MEKVNFVQINMHKAETALAELLMRLELDKGPTIACMTEPYTYRNRIICKPGGMKAMPSMTLDLRPRAAIFVSNVLSPTEIVEVEDLSLIHI